MYYGELSNYSTQAIGLATFLLDDVFMPSCPFRSIEFVEPYALHVPVLPTYLHVSKNVSAHFSHVSLCLKIIEATVRAT